MRQLTIKQAESEIRTKAESLEGLYAEKRNGKHVCPHCGKADTVWSGITGYCKLCYRDFDIIDHCAKRLNTSREEAVVKLAPNFDIAITPADATEAAQQPRSADGDTEYAPTAKAPQRAAQGVTRDLNFAEYYRACAGRIDDAAEILNALGISADTCKAFAPFPIGFDPAADPRNAPGATDGMKLDAAPAIIIPNGVGSYIAIRSDGRMLTSCGLAPDISNLRAIHGRHGDPVFVVPSALDMLALLEVGAQVVSLNGNAANVQALLDSLGDAPTESTVIVCMGSAPGETAVAERLRNGLNRLNVPNILGDIMCGKCNALEALRADRDAFAEAAAAATNPKPDGVATYIAQAMGTDIEWFKASAGIRSGFANLDAKQGDLYAGLYVIAAISSLGKTTFAAQMADNIAASGHDVLYFSLEQSRLELVSKSIARATAQKDMKTAVNALAIRRGEKPPQVVAAVQDYCATVGDRLSVIEGNFRCNVAYTEQRARDFVAANGSAPVIVIDYLQILQPAEDPKGRKQTTRDAIDDAITSLKRLSRELNCVVIVISSVNRANYLTPIDFEALKESGCIEYSCDVVWGLQLGALTCPEQYGEDATLFDKEGNVKRKREVIKIAKREEPRRVELHCLKNRYGKTNYRCAFEYYPANDLFIVDGHRQSKIDAEEESKTKKAKKAKVI